MLDLGESTKESEMKTILTRHEKKLKTFAKKLPALNEIPVITSGPISLNSIHKVQGPEDRRANGANVPADP